MDSSEVSRFAEFGFCQPDNVTFEQAASVPVAAFTARQGLRDKGHIQPGQKLLIGGLVIALERNKPAC